MRFTLAGREFDLRWSQLLLAAAAFFIFLFLLIIFAVLGLIFGLIQPGTPSSPLIVPSLQTAITPVTFTDILGNLVPYVFCVLLVLLSFKIADIFKIKKDTGFCRSISFFSTLFLFVLSLLFDIIYPPTYSFFFVILQLLSAFFSMVYFGIIFYLISLIILEYNPKLAKKAILPSLYFSIGYILMGFLGGLSDKATTPFSTNVFLLIVLNNLVYAMILGLIIFYHTQEGNVEKKAALFYFVVSIIIFAIRLMATISSASVTWFWLLTKFIEFIVILGLLFFLSGMRFQNNNKDKVTVTRQK